MIAAGKDDIKKWFERGVVDGYKYMLVVYDRMEYPDDSDYPSYADDAEEAQNKVREYGKDELCKVMEVYDLTADMEAQLSEERAWNLPG